MRAFASLLAVVGILPSFAAAQGVWPADYLAVAQAVTRIADGEPWNASMSTGRSVRLTLNADGSGTFEDPVAMPIAWIVKQDDVCINFRMAGATQCFRFKATTDSFEAYSADRLSLTLTR